MYKPPFPQSNFPFSDANDPAQNRSPFTIPTVADKRKKAEKTPKASQNQQRNQPRKSKGKPKNMDFISQRERLDGTVSFCVQIRKRVGGNSLKSSRTFHTLEEARTWRDNTLAEIQLGLFEPAQKSCAKTTIRICDVISRRLSEGRELKSSASADHARTIKVDHSGGADHEIGSTPPNVAALASPTGPQFQSAVDRGVPSAPLAKRRHVLTKQITLCGFEACADWCAVGCVAADSKLREDC